METMLSKTYIDNTHPYTIVTLTELKPGKEGMIQIVSDWGHYAAWWGSMGMPLKDFILQCNSGYIERNLQVKMNYLGVKREAFGRLTKFMAHCWPKVRAMLEEDKDGLQDGTTGSVQPPVATKTESVDGQGAQETV